MKQGTKQVHQDIQWFAGGGGIRQTGPFATQMDAVKAMRLVDGSFAPDVFVWPEETPAPKKTKPSRSKK